MDRAEAMIAHCFVTHPRDRWCAEFHVRTYLRFCSVAVAAVDGSPEFAAWLRSIDPRVYTVDVPARAGLPADSTNDRGIVFNDSTLRQAAIDRAMGLRLGSRGERPMLIVFGDTDEVPTFDVQWWIRGIIYRKQKEERWYVPWVNLWDDYQHAIGGGSPWSFQNTMGNKKCLAMQPGDDMVYPFALQHLGLEPGRPDGGPAPQGPGRHLIDSPKLLHLKYGSSVYRDRPESLLPRHAPNVMLRGGEVVDVPDEWLWPEMPL